MPSPPHTGYSLPALARTGYLLATMDILAGFAVRISRPEDERFWAMLPCRTAVYDCLNLQFVRLRCCCGAAT